MDEANALHPNNACQTVFRSLRVGPDLEARARARARARAVNGLCPIPYSSRIPLLEPSKILVLTVNALGDNGFWRG